MSISGLDLNLVHRASAGRGGLVVTVAPELLRRPIQVAPDRNFVPMEGDPPRPSGAAEKPDYGRFRLAEPVGARIDLLC